MTKPKHTRPENSRDSRIVSIICGAIFAVFCVLYLHLLQPDLIGLEQHRASSGQTVYNPLVGTIILSTLLTLTGFLLHYLIRLPLKVSALSWMPSCYLLLILTCTHFDDIPSDAGKTPVAALCIIPVVYFISLILSRIYPYAQTEKLPLGSYLRTNLLILSLLFFVTGRFANTNHLFHYEMKVARLAGSGFYDDALQVGSHYAKTTRNLTSQRAYALSQKGELGEGLFSYPMQGSQYLLPIVQDRVFSRSNRQVFRSLGYIPNTDGDFPTTRFLEMANRRDTLSSRPLHDYLLCAYLLDRNLPAFNSLLKQTYMQSEERLPRYFREALLLSAQAHEDIRADSTTWTTQDAERFDDFLGGLQELGEDSLDAVASSCLFGDTYWHYYFFE